jgi:hypothetical protein
MTSLPRLFCDSRTTSMPSGSSSPPTRPGSPRAHRATLQEVALVVGSANGGGIVAHGGADGMSGLMSVRSRTVAVASSP